LDWTNTLYRNSTRKFTNCCGKETFFININQTEKNVFKGTPLMFPLNSSTQSFNINSLTIVNYGLKIPGASFGSYSSLNSASKNP